MSSFNSGNDFAGRASATATTGVPTACPACRSSSISTTAKSPDVNSYWRCGSCGEIWNMSRRVAPRSAGNPWR